MNLLDKFIIDVKKKICKTNISVSTDADPYLVKLVREISKDKKLYIIKKK